jgi:hypothetical protein
MERCRRCKRGRLRVISSGYHSNIVIVHCENSECDVLYEEELERKSLDSKGRAREAPAPDAA